MLRVVSGLAAVIPGGQPVADTLLGITSLAGVVGAFFARRKSKALDTVVKAVNPIPGVGKLITKVAASDGTSIDVEKSYVKAMKDIIPESSLEPKVDALTGREG